MSFLFWQLCCLFFDLCIIITPLISSSPSYMSLHWNTFSWLQANHCMSSREAANADFITHNLTQPGTESTIYLTRDNHINYNTITRQSLLYIIYVSETNITCKFNIVVLHLLATSCSTITFLKVFNISRFNLLPHRHFYYLSLIESLFDSCFGKYQSICAW